MHALTVRRHGTTDRDFCKKREKPRIIKTKKKGTKRNDSYSAESRKIFERFIINPE